MDGNDGASFFSPMSLNIITFNYTLRNKSGEVLDTSGSGSPISFLEGSGSIIEGLEEPLKALEVGEKKEVIVEAKRGYGERDESMIQIVERSLLPVEDISIGDQFRAGEDNHAPVVKVVALDGDKVTLDANHPLAGEDLFFEVEITEKRAATETEISHGHVHGSGGHHHHEEKDEGGCGNEGCGCKH